MFSSSFVISGHRRAADRHHAAEDGAVERRGQLDRSRPASADYLGNVVAGDGIVARVLALRREGDVHAGAAFGAGDFDAVTVALFKQRNDNFLGCAGGRWCFQAQ